MKVRKFANVNRQICVACGCCETVCPRQAIHVVNGCYAAVNGERCVGCGLCGKVCPVGCIALVEREAEIV